MVELKNQEDELPIKSEGDCYDNEVVITEDEKRYTEKDLPPHYEDLLYEQWRDKQIRKESEAYPV